MNKNKKLEKPKTLAELDLYEYFSLPKGLRLGCNHDIYDYDNSIQNSKPNTFRYGGYYGLG